MDLAALDDIIHRLLEVRETRPGKQVQLTEAEIRQLCLSAKTIFMQQPGLLELEAPIKICGNVNTPSPFFPFRSSMSSFDQCLSILPLSFLNVVF
jgi:hypothetical protein